PGLSPPKPPMSATPPGGSDRNLLFGILALQMDFIDRDTLVRGMSAWVLDKAKPLGQILCEQGAVAEDTHDLLEALVAKHLSLHNNDAQQSLASVSSLGSVRDDLGRIADPDLRVSLAQATTARPGQPDSYASRPAWAASSAAPGQRFRILRPH